MKKIIVSSVLAISLGILVGCANGPSFNELAASAEKEMKIAKSMNYLWRDTEKIMKEARKNNDKKLAKKALDQAKMAQAQAKAEANPRVVYP